MEEQKNRAYEFIEKGEFHKLFELMEDVFGDTADMSALKKEYILGKASFDFTDRLRLLVFTLFPKKKPEQVTPPAPIEECEGNLDINFSVCFDVDDIDAIYQNQIREINISSEDGSDYMFDALEDFHTFDTNDLDELKEIMGLDNNLVFLFGSVISGKTCLAVSLCEYANYSEKATYINEFDFFKVFFARPTNTNIPDRTGSMNTLVHTLSTRYNKINILDSGGEQFRYFALDSGINIKATGFLRFLTKPTVFLLLVPFDSYEIGYLYPNFKEFEFDDKTISNFLLYIQKINPFLFDISKFVLIVTKWDLNNGEYENATTFLKQNLPTSYEIALKRPENFVVMPYSIGEISESGGADTDFRQVITQFNHKYPEKLWEYLCKTFRIYP